jgi:hypothetical protein
MTPCIYVFGSLAILALYQILQKIARDYRNHEAAKQADAQLEKFLAADSKRAALFNASVADRSIN